MSMRDGYEEAAAVAVELIGAPEVARAWDEPSALAGMTVGGLAGHLGFQLFSVSRVLTSAPTEEQPIALTEHFARAAWIGAPLDADVSTGIVALGEETGADGPGALRERAAAALEEQRGELARAAGDRTVFIARSGWALTLDDYLATRLLELVVHLDDLAVSVGLPTRDLPTVAFDPVLVLLARLAAGKHGQAALLRALARAERAPGAINAL
ncbi:maleylpyruvate isomerase N-terminal domain-containing protein [Streptomyces sp. NBC_01218]|uniref:maleylpyruvate isomerase N-terminal domain-containing protein n=1 Tax=Streptomyces sp. NBC_01218 TaxID=2903780 RepID=UPI002E10980E|nr:maleylpyruvate isomerase N-terminal domain-containing protein [Streptomyces sp. NBC_01218]